MTSKITEEKFKAFIAVRDSGLTNMWDASEVIRLAKGMEGVILTERDVTDIIHDFSELSAKYGDPRDDVSA